MKIYCDTDALLNNIRRHEEQPGVRRELDALTELLDRYVLGQLTLYRSRVTTLKLITKIRLPASASGVTS
jgi:hypothetical protein